MRDLILALGNDRLDPVAAKPGSDRPGAIALVPGIGRGAEGLVGAEWVGVWAAVTLQRRTPRVGADAVNGGCLTMR